MAYNLWTSSAFNYLQLFSTFASIQQFFNHLNFLLYSWISQIATKKKKMNAYSYSENIQKKHVLDEHHHENMVLFFLMYPKQWEQRTAVTDIYQVLPHLIKVEVHSPWSEEEQQVLCFFLFVVCVCVCIFSCTGKVSLSQMKYDTRRTMLRKDAMFPVLQYLVRKKLLSN